MSTHPTRGGQLPQFPCNTQKAQDCKHCARHMGTSGSLGKHTGKGLPCANKAWPDNLCLLQRQSPFPHCSRKSLATRRAGARAARVPGTGSCTQTLFSGSAPCAVKPKPIMMGTPKDITNKCHRAAKQQLSILLSCSGKQQLPCNWKDRFSSLSAKAANRFFLEHTQHNIPLGQTRIQQPNQTQPLPEHSESVQVPAQQKQTIEDRGKNRNDLQGSSCCSSL